MSNPQRYDIYEWNRQSYWSIVFFVFNFLKAIATNIPALIGLYTVLSKTGWNVFIFIALLLGLLTVLGLFSFIAFKRFRYKIEGDEFLIESGVFVSKKLRISFDRIQSININQSLIHRFIGVVSLEMDTAGSKGKEVHLSAISSKFAEYIKGTIYSHIEDNSSYNPLHEDETVTQERNKEKKVLFRLSASDNLKYGLLDNHLRNLLYVLALAFGLFGQINDLFEDQASNFIDNNINGMEATIMANIIFSVIVMIIFIMLIVLVISVGKSFLKYFDLKMWVTNKGYGMIAGLLSRQETHIALHKIQTLHWTTNPLKSKFDMYDLVLSQARSTDNDPKNNKVFTVPGMGKKGIKAILNDVLKEEIPDYFGASAFSIDSSYAKRFTFYSSIVPVIGIGVLSYFFGWNYMVYALLIAALFYVAYTLFQSNFRYIIGEKVIWVSKGVLGRTFEAAEVNKIQTIELVQSPYQRRKDLASLKLFTAGSNIKIPYIPLELAYQIRAYLLKEVNTSNEAWM